MYIVTGIKIQLLNGSFVQRQVKMTAVKEFQTKEALERFRNKKIEYDKGLYARQWPKLHPGENVPEIDVLLTVTSKEEWYQQ